MEKAVTPRAGGGGDGLEALLGGDVDLLGDGSELELLGGRVMLGVRLETITEPVAGVKVLEVVRGSPAEAAQLREGDIIVAADGAAMKTLEEIQGLIRKQKPGHELKLSIRRGEIDLETTAKLQVR